MLGPLWQYVQRRATTSARHATQRPLPFSCPSARPALTRAVAAGPQPERLSSGDWLLLYNIDTGFPYHPNPLGRCAVGWAILDGADPSRIVARAENVLLIPELPYETCAASGQGETCQQPMVVFATGLRPIGGDEFLVIYGGADTVVGAARILVNVSAARNK